MRPIFIRGVKTIDIARRAEAERERQRRFAAKRRQEEAARVAAERKAKEDEDHERMVRAYSLSGGIMWLAKHVKRGRSFEKSCRIAEIKPEEVRMLLQHPPVADGWDAHYVVPALDHLRRRLDVMGVDWR
jgi:hypothetical protein